MDAAEIVNSLLEAEPTMSQAALNAAYSWIHSGDHKSLLRPEIARQFAPYRLEKPTELYQGRRGDRGAGFSSWSKSREVAEKFAQGGEVISRVFKPEETVVDFERVQKARGWQDDFIDKELEVVVL
jgi:hypothetical protein